MQTEELTAQILKAINGKRRHLIAIAGPPASGKSTLAEQLSASINQQKSEDVSVVIPMDGFHLDNATLDERGLRQRKGAPETFDAEGFVALIDTLKTADTDVAIPLFDRKQDAVISNAKTITPQQQILLVEGNYLLLKQQPWAQLKALFDYSVFLNPGLEVLEQRLVQRWLNHDYDEAGASQRALANDIPNARFVVEHSVGADLVRE